MKNDEKTTLNEYRMESSSESGADNKSSNKSNRDNSIDHNDAPWDNNWLSSVTNG